MSPEFTKHEAAEVRQCLDEILKQVPKPARKKLADKIARILDFIDAAERHAPLYGRV